MVLRSTGGDVAVLVASHGDTGSTVVGVSVEAGRLVVGVSVEAGRLVVGVSVLVSAVTLETGTVRVVVVLGGTSQTRSDTSTRGVVVTGKTVIVLMADVEVTGDGLGRSVRGSEVGSGVLEGLSTGRAKERFDNRKRMVPTRMYIAVEDLLVQTTRGESGRRVKPGTLLVVVESGGVVGGVLVRHDG
jgi:hypothetical protein